MFSTEEFAEFGKKHILYLNIMTRIKGYPYDQQLREVGGRGFPTIVALNSKGEVIGKPRGRDIAAFEALMGDSGSKKKRKKSRKKSKKKDPAKLAMNFLRKVRSGRIKDTPKDRKAYIAVRGVMKEDQRKLVVKAMAKDQLKRGKKAVKKFKSTSKKHQQGLLDVQDANMKLGILPKDGLPAGEALEAWMVRAAAQKDPQLLAALLEQSEKAGKPSPKASRHKKTLEFLWSGRPSLRLQPRQD